MAFLRKLSIRSQLFILAASTIIVILVIIFHTYSMMSGMITRSHEEYVKQTVSEIKKNVASNHDVIYRIMQDISYNPDVQDYLVETDKLIRYDRFTKLNKYLNSQKELKEGIQDIIISGNNGTWIDLYGGNRYVVPLRVSLSSRKVNGYYAGMQQFGALYGRDEKLIFATSITYSQQGELFNRNIGTAFFIVDASALVSEQEYSSKETGTQIYLLDRSRKIIASNSQARTGSDFKEMKLGSEMQSNQIVQLNDRSYVVEAEPLADIEGTILSMAPENELLRELLDIRKQELIILGIALLVLAVPFMFIINNILRPLKKLIFFIMTIRRGDLLKYKKRIALHGYMEISIVATELNSMLDEIDLLTQRLLETNTRLYGIELEKKKSELAFLRSQINPHFLYNTLEAITGIAVVEKQERIKAMTRSLSSIFRYSIKGASEVPLSEEIRMIESYIRIQQIRFADRFAVHYELAAEALAYRVPKMILQPLVENAVYHGFEPTLREGELWIRGFVADDGTLVIRIEDNGMGIPRDRLEEVRGMVAAPVSGLQEPSEQKSIGLVNVNNRIQLMFGSECGLRIESAEGEGTKVELTIKERGEQHA
ncbi:sensor histidine kinase [Paenibacillus sp. R14(2021)]|uniref:cache domain-containing sensor histidine kinase n=1 Tax=Paenibacillus sp. R14(2021) TaxID=2859228 RepID=UPI001C61609D|nr:histidine kinase [Paenibacillus sp. R14(2021)]